MSNMNTSVFTGYGAGYGTNYGSGYGIGYGSGYGMGYGSSYGTGYENMYGYGLSGNAPENNLTRGLGLTDEEKGRRGIQGPREADGSGRIKDARGIEDTDKVEDSRGIKDPGAECQTCKNRKYKDGSDEMVSFKSPTHISPESAAAAVRAHEKEHVANAYSKAAAKNGKVISASVSIHTAVCPECGRTYISGGTTHTQIKYYNEDNPYQKDLKSADRTKYIGMNLDYAV